MISPGRPARHLSLAIAALVLATFAAAACSSDPVSTGTGDTSSVAAPADTTEGTTKGTTGGTTPGTTRGTTPGTTPGTGDGGDDPDGGGQTTTTESATPTSINDDYADWCTDFRSWLADLDNLPDDTKEEERESLIEAKRRFAELDENAPAAIADDFAIVNEQIQLLDVDIDDGPPSTPESRAAAQRLEQWSTANCGFNPDDLG